MEQLRDAIIGLDETGAKEIARRGLAEGVDPLGMIQHGIKAAMDDIGRRFSAEELFLPELMLSANAADAAVGVIEPALIKAGTTSKTAGKVLLATVEGDLHDIGKNILALLLKSSGFEVLDLGVDQKNDAILEAAGSNEVGMIGLSALLTTTMHRMKEFVELLQERGVRDRFKVVVGGAPITREFSDSIGADGYGADAVMGVELATKFLGA